MSNQSEIDLFGNNFEATNTTHERTARRIIRDFLWPDRIFNAFPWMHLIFYFLVIFAFVGALLEQSFGADTVAPILNFTASLAFFALELGIIGSIVYWFLVNFLAILIAIAETFKMYTQAITARLSKRPK